MLDSETKKKNLTKDIAMYYFSFRLIIKTQTLKTHLHFGVNIQLNTSNLGAEQKE